MSSLRLERFPRRAHAHHPSRARLSSRGALALGLAAGLSACSSEPLSLGTLTQHLGGIEGTMEYALDAPWRIEPNEVSPGVMEYGAIPIQLSIFDTDIIGSDTGDWSPDH